MSEFYYVKRKILDRRFLYYLVWTLWFFPMIVTFFLLVMVGFVITLFDGENLFRHHGLAEKILRWPDVIWKYYCAGEGQCSPIKGNVAWEWFKDGHSMKMFYCTKCKEAFVKPTGKYTQIDEYFYEVDEHEDGLYVNTDSATLTPPMKAELIN